MKKQLLILSLLGSSFLIAQTPLTISDSIYSGGVYRKYMLYIPAIYNSAHSVPLVFDIHGYNCNVDQQIKYGDFRPIADTANFIIALPQALGSTPAWKVLSTVDSGAADRAFIINLLDTIKSHYTINANKIFCAGYSQGGCMSYDMAALNNTNFAAIASVCGSMVPSHFAACAPNRPTPVMQIHGTADIIIPYDGSAGILNSAITTTNIDSLVKFWVAYNNCNKTPISSNILNSNTSDGCTVAHYVYNGGDQGSSVELFKVINGGHTWPAVVVTGGHTVTNDSIGLGNKNMDFNASKEIWRFFSRQQSTLSISTGIAEQPFLNSHSVDIFPNPSSGVFTLQSAAKITSIEITNVLGATVLSQQINADKAAVDLGSQANGVYFISIQTSEGTVNKKIVISH